MKKRTFAGCTIGIAGAVLSSFNTVAAPPPEGSEQWNMTRDYKDFIVNMLDEDGMMCCDFSDGRADLEERIVTDDKGDTYYEVKVTREAYPHYGDVIAAEGQWIKISKNELLTAERAKQICEDHIKANPESNTCKPPPFNMLWFSPDGFTYCYWPRPSMY